MENESQALCSTESGTLVVTRSVEDVKEINSIRKQQIRQTFSSLNKAGYLHKLASYEYDTDDVASAWKIELVHNQEREGVMLNLIKAEMGDAKSSRKLMKMETSLNDLYGEMKNCDVSDGVLAYQNIPRGMLVAVWDDSTDQHGRFRRGRVIQTMSKPSCEEGRPRVLGMMQCELVDEGRVDVFPTDHLYLLPTKFLHPPARFFTIKLDGLKRFEKSPKFARVFETMVKTYGYRYSMRIVKTEEQPHPVLHVVLTSTKLSVTVSVNDYLLSELLKVGVDSLLSPCPAKGSTFEDTVVCTVREKGQVSLCEMSREMDTIEDLLTDAEENFSSYLAVYEGSPEQERLTVGDICVALHPEDGFAHRCKIVSVPLLPWIMTGNDSDTVRKTATVDWIDIGGLLSQIPASKLIHASFVSPILAQAEPRSKQFQLANVKNVKNLEGVLSFLPPGKEVSARVVATVSPSTVGPARTPEQRAADPVLVDLVTHKMSHRGEQFRSVNRKLLKMEPPIVEPTDAPFLFLPKQYLQPSGLLHIPMNYPLRNWASRVHKSGQRDNNIMVSKGDEIIFFVSELISSTDFTIHPWESREAVLNLEGQLREYFQDAAWARKARDELITSIPSGNFLIYKKGYGDYSRAKIIQEVFADRSDTRCMLRILLLEKGRYDKAEVWNLLRIAHPFPLVSTLSPQGAVGRWKYAVDELANLKKSLKLTTTSQLQVQQHLKNAEGKLMARLEGEFPNVKTRRAITATVASIKIDENGRAEFELNLKHVEYLSGIDSG